MNILSAMLTLLLIMDPLGNIPLFLVPIATPLIAGLSTLATRDIT